MAANGRSNLHNDAYMTDTYAGRRSAGPEHGAAVDVLRRRLRLGHVRPRRADRDDLRRPRRPRLVLLDPRTLDLLAEFPLPPRQPGAANPFTDFAGGGYFYLDHLDRAVIPTTNRHIWVVEQTQGPLGPGFGLARDYDVSGSLSVDDKLFSALPDWAGRIWWVSQAGVVGTIEPGSGHDPDTLDTNEQITNSFAVDETGGVYIVSDAALYRFDADAERHAGRHLARGVREHGRAQARPGEPRVRDHADAGRLRVRGDHRQRRPDERGRVPARPHGDAAGGWPARAPVFEPGAGATDNSLIGAGRSLIVENNYGYSGPTATTQGATTTPGLERVDITDEGGRCKTVWRSSEIAPSVVPKLSLATGLVYTYTKPADPSGNDAWYFTALDFRKRDDGLQAARRDGARLQQPLRPGLARPGRDRLRRHAGRARAAARPVVLSTIGASRRRMKMPPSAHRAGSHIGNAGHSRVRVVERADGGDRRLDHGPDDRADQRVQPSRPARAGAGAASPARQEPGCDQDRRVRPARPSRGTRRRSGRARRRERGAASAEARGARRAAPAPGSARRRARPPARTRAARTTPSGRAVDPGRTRRLRRRGSRRQRPEQRRRGRSRRPAGGARQPPRALGRRRRWRTRRHHDPGPRWPAHARGGPSKPPGCRRTGTA